jgi:hypothetical protein
MGETPDSTLTPTPLAAPTTCRARRHPNRQPSNPQIGLSAGTPKQTGGDPSHRRPSGPILHAGTAPRQRYQGLIRRYPYRVQPRPDRSMSWRDRWSAVRTRTPDAWSRSPGWLPRWLPTSASLSGHLSHQHHGRHSSSRCLVGCPRVTATPRCRPLVVLTGRTVRSAAKITIGYVVLDQAETRQPVTHVT